MPRERVSEDIYVFTSGVYAQVTSGLILTPAGAVIIDTLPFPNETREILNFVKDQGMKVKFVVNTHSHADHVLGNYLFRDADVVAHRLCRLAMIKYAERGLREAQEQNAELEEVVIRLPNLIFEGEMTLRLGGRTIQMLHMPGHTSDSIVALVKEERILFSGDTMMPVPYVVWGDVNEMIESLRAIRKMNLENIVQGHGEVLLRGEINETIDSSVAYLHELTRCVAKAIKDNTPERELLLLDIEKCGKSRIPLNGLVQQLHQGNLRHLYRKMRAQSEAQKAR